MELAVKAMVYPHSYYSSPLIYCRREQRFFVLCLLISYRFTESIIQLRTSSDRAFVDTSFFINLIALKRLAPLSYQPVTQKPSRVSEIDQLFLLLPCSLSRRVLFFRFFPSRPMYTSYFSLVRFPTFPIQLSCYDIFSQYGDALVSIIYER